MCLQHFDSVLFAFLLHFSLFPFLEAENQCQSVNRSVVPLVRFLILDYYAGVCSHLPRRRAYGHAVTLL